MYFERETTLNDKKNSREHTPFPFVFYIFVAQNK